MKPPGTPAAPVKPETPVKPDTPATGGKPPGKDLGEFATGAPTVAN